jgi:hypothetical protein
MWFRAQLDIPERDESAARHGLRCHSSLGGKAFPDDVEVYSHCWGDQQIGILAHEFPPSTARSLAFATFSAGAPLGGAIGFAIGGVMTEYSRYVHRFCAFPS